MKTDRRRFRLDGIDWIGKSVYWVIDTETGQVARNRKGHILLTESLLRATVHGWIQEVRHALVRPGRLR